MGDMADFLNDSMDPEDDCFQNEEFREVKYDAIMFETRNAWLIRLPIKDDLTNVEIWLPKSRCALMPDCKISIPQWLIEEKDIQEYVKE